MYVKKPNELVEFVVARMFRNTENNPVDGAIEPFVNGRELGYHMFLYNPNNKFSHIWIHNHRNSDEVVIRMGVQIENCNNQYTEEIYRNSEHVFGDKELFDAVNLLEAAMIETKKRGGERR